MALKKLTLIASFAFAGYVAVSCSSKEDQNSYDKYYGSGRSAREEAALSTPRAANGRDELRINPDSVNSLSVTEHADSEIGASDEIVDGTPEPAGKTVEQISTKPKEAAKPEKKEEAPKTQGPPPADIAALLNKHTCSACHRPYERLVGPAYSEVAKKKYSPETIVDLVYKPQPEHWPGYPPMAPMTQVPKEDVLKLARWINSL
jgi:cytochrome c551/c552